MLQATTVSVRRWWRCLVWRRRRCRVRWRRQLLVIPLLHVGSISHHEGVSGASADTKGSQAVQVAGQPQLGPLWRSCHVVAQLVLRQPRRDLQLCHGIQVWHKGWVLNPRWMKGGRGQGLRNVNFCYFLLWLYSWGALTSRCLMTNCLIFEYMLLLCWGDAE